MAWTEQRIRAEWLGAAQLARGPNDVVRLFNLAVDTFGDEWLAGRRKPGLTGVSPTLDIVTTGELIEAIQDLPGADKVLVAFGMASGVHAPKHW